MWSFYLYPFLERGLWMKKYDLHIHSQFSDGDYSVEEIVSKVRECGIEISCQ